METILETEEFTVSGTSHPSAVQNLNRCVAFSYHLIYTNGSGTAKLQYSNDIESPDSWIDIQTFNLSGDDAAMWNPPVRGAAYARILFENADTTVVKLVFNNKKEL